jgi:hypothetical protein
VKNTNFFKSSPKNHAGLLGMVGEFKSEVQRGYDASVAAS